MLSFVPFPSVPFSPATVAYSFALLANLVLVRLHQGDAALLISSIHDF
ncbi:hypothetical protein Sinac_0441 [Singulisphaera acidiphila DSM 18658]|uniref:Uncharacterized protein n=1 Tax=Singulisphaera acidiphila (strain ATCC BAA-1392 / DSM 18658 / VKM B-2454 / MOB10) TaxID=886293 RepID=L0D672_SINAD|nr:hypothetical protein Sinac_0441 [Singulisphaera acidiphila DSM 18658]